MRWTNVRIRIAWSSLFLSFFLFFFHTLWKNMRNPVQGLCRRWYWKHPLQFENLQSPSVPIKMIDAKTNFTHYYYLLLSSRTRLLPIPFPTITAYTHIPSVVTPPPPNRRWDHIVITVIRVIIIRCNTITIDRQGRLNVLARHVNDYAVLYICAVPTDMFWYYIRTEM